MTEYVIGTYNDRDEIIDFINYVFSQAKFPHDFKKYMPKSYADDVQDLGAIHYLAKKDGKIKAVVANRIIDVSVNGKILKIGLIGNVSVHPYSRGEGFMKVLLNQAIDEAKQNGVDLLVLGGQRQRYGYFGFENAGTDLLFTVSKDNIRHCFPDVDSSVISFRPFDSATDEEMNLALALYERRIYHTIRKREELRHIMNTWNAGCDLICKNGKMIGYLYGPFTELVLQDEADLPAVLKAVFERDKLTTIDIAVSPTLPERAAFLSSICELSFVKTVEMISVLCWERVLDAFLALKSQLCALQDGVAELVIDGGVYRICAENGVPTVETVDAPGGNAVHLSHNQALQLFFGIHSLVLPDERLKNWAPLPFGIDGPDTY